MRALPPLLPGSPSSRLPMADRSAATLVEVVLAGDDPEITSPLTERLAADPPLLVWTVCQAARREAFQPRSVPQAAQWLRKHALEVLQWAGGHHGSLDASMTGGPERFADQVAHVLQVSELAALLAASRGEAAAEEAFLSGLLYDASQWMALTDPDVSPSNVLPQWLVEASQDPAALYAAEAAQILADQTTTGPPDFNPEACRRRALEARQRWLQTVDGPIDRLPALTAKLARLQQLETQFHQALESEKLEAMAEFAAGAGHEINNPLAIIGGRAQLLLREETDPERRRELALVNAQVRRAHEMIADMRLFARPPRPEPETVDLVHLIDALVEDLGPQAAARAITLSRSGDDGPLELEADPAQLNVALRALCKNSVEAIGYGGRIDVSARRSGADVEIHVTDDGPGIPPEPRRHLFDPFYSARQAGRGLGFGLSKCWRIVTNHHGRIDIQSDPGQGATFTITLPQTWRGESDQV